MKESEKDNNTSSSNQNPDFWFERFQVTSNVMQDTVPFFTLSLTRNSIANKYKRNNSTENLSAYIKALNDLIDFISNYIINLKENFELIKNVPSEHKELLDDAEIQQWKQKYNEEYVKSEVSRFEKEIKEMQAELNALPPVLPVKNELDVEKVIELERKLEDLQDEKAKFQLELTIAENAFKNNKSQKNCLEYSLAITNLATAYTNISVISMQIALLLKLDSTNSMADKIDYYIKENERANILSNHYLDVQLSVVQLLEKGEFADLLDTNNGSDLTAGEHLYNILNSGTDAKQQAPAQKPKTNGWNIALIAGGATAIAAACLLFALAIASLFVPFLQFMAPVLATFGVAVLTVGTVVAAGTGTVALASGTAALVAGVVLEEKAKAPAQDGKPTGGVGSPVADQAVKQDRAKS